MAITRRFKPKTKSKSKSKSRKSRVINIRKIRFSKSGKTYSIPTIPKNSQEVERLAKSLKMNSNQQKDEDFFIGVTASWCGACHNISDRLNKALKHAKRPGSRIDDTLMDTFNKSMNSSIQPPPLSVFHCHRYRW